MSPNPAFSRRVFISAILLSVVQMGAGLPASSADIPWSDAQLIDDATHDLSDLMTADLDLDGRHDLVGFGPSGLEWWPSAQGAGTTISAGSTDLTAVVAGDLDGDGDPDLAATSATAGLIWWRNTNGDGSTWTETVITAGLSLADLTRADLDQDGDLDLIAARSGAAGAVEWWENTQGDAGAWARTSIDSYAHASSVEVADLDHDGDPDVIATADQSSDLVTWWENSMGDAGTWTEHTVSSALTDPRGVAVGSLNGDGFYDLVVADSSGLVWFHSDGTPDAGWTSGALAATGASDPRILDLNLDGTADLLTTAGHQVSWWENPGDGAAWVARTGPTANDLGPVQALSVGQNGLLDLVAADQTDDDLLLWSNETLSRNADLGRELTLDSAFAGGRSAFAADLDGDGDLDVIGAAFDQGQVAWWENTDGAGTWTKRVIDDTVPYAFAVRAADLDADGDLDVIGAISRLTFDVGTNRIHWWRNDPGAGEGEITWTRQTVASPFGASDIWPVDMDRDGDLDLLSAAAGSDEIAWYANDGSAGGWTETVIDTTFDRVHSVVGVDIDRDGDTDIVAAGDTEDEIAWWENTTGDGSLPFTKHSIITDWDGAYDVWAADLDGDGDADVLAASQFEDRISWWENTDGAGTFGPENTLGDPLIGAEGFFNQAYAVETADMDGNGTLDIVGAAFKDGGHLAWWSNEAGDGSLWQKHEITVTHDGAGTAHVADINGDGLPDLLSTAQTDGRISYWPNDGGQFALETTSIAPAELPPGSDNALFDIRMSHLGRSGEGDIELASLEIRLQDQDGDPLDPAQVNGVFERLRIWRDDPAAGIPGSPDPQDSELAVLETLSPDAEGLLEMIVPDGAAAAALAVGEQGRFFLLAETTSDSDQQGLSGIRVIHITSASSRAEDRDHDIDLRLAYAPDTDTGMLALADTADLQLQLQSSATEVDAGDLLTWTATLTHLGPDTAVGPEIQFTLPPGVTFQHSAGCQEDPSGVPTCSLNDLPDGNSAQVSIHVQVGSGTSGSVTLTAVAASTVFDPTSANNAASSEVSVIASADLDARVVAPAVYTAGAMLTYRVWVENQGPGPADATVLGNLPIALTSASWTCQAFDGASCGGASGSGAIDDTPTLPSGGSLEYSVTAQVSSGQTDPIQLDADVAAGAGASDPQTANNSSAATVYSAADSIFVDGFESGDTSAW